MDAIPGTLFTKNSEGWQKLSGEKFYPYLNDYTIKGPNLSQKLRDLIGKETEGFLVEKILYHEPVSVEGTEEIVLLLNIAIVAKKTSVLFLRIQEAAKLLKGHLTENDLTQMLARIGIDDSDIGLKVLEAKTTKIADLEGGFHCLENYEERYKKIPQPRLKTAWEILKGSDPFKKNEAAKQPDLKDFRPIPSWKDDELLAQYNKDCPTPIEDELKKRTRGKPVIIFSNGGVDQKLSLQMIRMARRQDTPSMYKLDNGKTVVVYAIGEFPADVLYECPIHSDVLLVNGYCEICNQVWDIKDHDKNAFLRLITNHEDVDFRIYRKKDMEELEEDFPQVFKEFSDLKDEGRLPSLKKKPSRAREGDPFRYSAHRTH